MATYTTDLSDITLAETGVYVEMIGWVLGDTPIFDPDLFIQGTQCVTNEANSKTGVGHSNGVDYGSQITFATGEVFLTWMQCTAGNAMDTFANGGYTVLAGSSTSDHYGWKVGGSDFGRNPYGGWVNVPVDPTYTPDYTAGAVTGFQFFAAGWVMVSAIGKGRPLCLDAIRYGRAELIAEGTGATFALAETENSLVNNRWGLLQAEGTGYLWKGLLTLGTATTAITMTDSNVNVTVDDTPRAYALFNKIEIRNALSVINWTGVNFTAVNPLGLSVGSFEMIDNATFNHSSATFTDMGTFIYLPNTTLTNFTHRRCALVTQGGSTMTNGTVDEPRGGVGVLVDNLNLITGYTFNSDGTGHAVDLGTITATSTVSWDNTDNVYTAASSGNETIVVSVDSGQTLTINVAPGASTPSVYNTGLGTVTVVSGQATISIKVLDENDESPLVSSSVTIKASDTAGVGLPYNESVTITSTGGVATVSHTAHGIADGKKVAIDGANENEYNRIKTITYIDADSYSYPISGTPASPATGTITATAVIIDGATDANGDISDTRSYSVDQPFTGLIQKGTGTNIYKARTTTGTVDSASGASQTILLTKD